MQEKQWSYLDIMQRAGKLNTGDLRPMKAMRRERNGWTRVRDMVSTEITSFFASAVSFASAETDHILTCPKYLETRL